MSIQQQQSDEERRRAEEDYADAMIQRDRMRGFTADPTHNYDADYYHDQPRAWTGRVPKKES